jgi:hypothetical protein
MGKLFYFAGTEVNSIQLTAMSAVSAVENHFISNERIVVKIETGISAGFVAQSYNCMFGRSVDPGVGHRLL